MKVRVLVLVLAGFLATAPAAYADDSTKTEDEVRFVRDFEIKIKSLENYTTRFVESGTNRGRRPASNNDAAAADVNLTLVQTKHER